VTALPGRLRSILVLSLLGLGAASCATTETANDRVNPEVPLWYHRPSGSMHVVLRRTLTAAARTVGEDYERGRAEVDPAHNRVFCGSADHGLYALRAGDGSSIWRFETLGVVQSEPLYDSELDLVYFGSHDGALYAVRAANGELVWRFNTGAEVAKKPVRLGEMIYVANGSDQLYALDRRTGAMRWQAHRTPALGMEVAGYAGPAVANGKVYIAYSDGHVLAYDAVTGNERWTPVDLSAEAEQSAGGEAPRYLDVDTTPIIDDFAATPQQAAGRVVYVASYAGGVFALDAETGSRVWSNDKALGVTDITLWREPAHLPNPRGPDKDGPMVPERKILLASSATTGLWGMDPSTGRMLWKNAVPEGGITAPVPIAGAVIVGTTRYGLFLLSPRNGKVIDGLEIGSGFAQTPAAFGNRAYAISNAGTFVGVSVEPPL
jgi:outer membrane protein assembly factor BamB